MIIYGAKAGIKSLLFPYGTEFIKFQYHQQMNLKMSTETKNTLNRVQMIIKNTMSKNEY